MAEIIKSRRNSKTLIIAASAAGVIALLVIAVLIYVWAITPERPGNDKLPTVENPSGGALTPDDKDENGQGGGLLEQIKDHFRPKQAAELSKLKKRSNVYTFLVCGVDADAVRTDTILIGTFDINAGKLSIMQIPRDTYINTDHKYKKINTAYAYGGIDELKKEIFETFGIEIDRFVVFKLSGFVEVVDIIGGVEIDVPRNMDYDDDVQNLHIHLKKGKQRLNGKQAEQFVRYRKGYAEGDLGRLKAQKLFLAAFVDQLLSTKNVLKLPELASSVIKSVKTDMTVNDMLYFGVNSMNLAPKDITVYTALGEPHYLDGVSYYSLYNEENREIINKVFNPYVSQIEELDIVELSRKDVDYYTRNSNGQSMAEILGIEEPASGENKSN